jgi:hypothetical protein
VSGKGSFSVAVEREPSHQSEKEFAKMWKNEVGVCN